MQTSAAYREGHLDDMQGTKNADEAVLRRERNVLKTGVCRGLEEVTGCCRAVIKIENKIISLDDVKCSYSQIP